MLGSIGVDLAALYAPVDVERFLQADGDILIESCHFRATGKGSFSANLALKKLASHKRLIVPSMQVSREENNWAVTAHPLFNPVWTAGGQELATSLLAVLQTAEERLRQSSEWKMHFSVRTRFTPAQPAEPRAVLNEVDISQLEQIYRWCGQAQRWVESKKVLDVAGGGGVSSKLLSRRAQDCLCVDWDPISLQIAFETFSAPNVLHYWLPSDSDLPRVIQEYLPDVICWFQALEPGTMRFIASAMTDDMQLVMPRDFALVAMAETLFESVRAQADLIVCRFPKPDACKETAACRDLIEPAFLWDSPKWQMRLSRNTLPIMLNGVLGYASPDDVHHLYRSVAHLSPQEPTIVEIGSFSGLSACIFSHSLRRHGLKGRVYCVDLWDTYVEMNPSARETGFFAYKSGQLRQLFDHYIHAAGATEVTPVCEDSACAWQNFADRSVDLLFVDGDHSYEGCLADLNNWYGKVKPDGVIVGHDYDWDTVRSAVRHFSYQHGLRLQEMAGGTMFLLLMPQASPYPQREAVPLELDVASCV